MGSPLLRPSALRTVLGTPGAFQKALPDLGLVPGGKGLPWSERDSTGAGPKPCQAVSGADSRLVKLGFSPGTWPLFVTQTLGIWEPY